MSDWVQKHRKMLVAAAGVALTIAAGYVAPDSTAGRIIAALLAVGTVAGVWAAPNKPMVPPAAQYLRDQAAARSAGKPTAGKP